MQQKAFKAMSPKNIQGCHQEDKGDQQIEIGHCDSVDQFIDAILAIKQTVQILES